MTQCPGREQLDALLAESLGAEEQAIVEQHIAACAVCRQRLDEQSALPVVAEPPIEQKDSEKSGWGGDIAGRLAAGLQATRQKERTSKSDAPPAIPGCQVRQLIGRGGMGAVYLAWQDGLERLVAVKVLPESLVADERARARFTREMAAVGRLNHPGVVTAFAAGQHHGVHYLLMEYVAGQDLAAINRQVGRLEVADACEVIRQAAIALQYAHQHGLVHRDIKPSNLMLTREGIVKVLDLGLARFQSEFAARDELTHSGQMVGTVDYMSPEQGQHSQVDIRSDIYSMGATLFKLLTQRSPLDCAEHAAPAVKLTALALGKRLSIRQQRDDIPDGLVDVLHRMLAQDPNDRFASPGEVASAIERFCQGNLICGLVEQAERSDSEQLEETETDSIRMEETSTTRVSQSSQSVDRADVPEATNDGQTANLSTTQVCGDEIRVGEISTSPDNFQVSAGLATRRQSSRKSARMLALAACVGVVALLLLMPVANRLMGLYGDKGVESSKAPTPQDETSHTPENSSEKEREGGADVDGTGEGPSDPIVGTTQETQVSLAKWLLGRGGHMRCVAEGNERRPPSFIDSKNPIPDVPFQLVAVSFPKVMATDEDLQRIAHSGLDSIQKITFPVQQGVTMVGLSAVADHMPQVTSLDLCGITEPHPTVRKINTDELIQLVRKFKHLQEILIAPASDHEADGEGARWAETLARMKSVQRIRYNKNFSKQCLERLTESSTLVSLEFWESPLVDDDLKLLARIPSLKQVVIGRCPNLSPAGLAHIGSLKQLTYLTFYEMPHLMSPELVAVAKQLPECKIEITDVKNRKFAIKPTTDIEELLR